MCYKYCCNKIICKYKYTATSISIQIKQIVQNEFIAPCDKLMIDIKAITNFPYIDENLRGQNPIYWFPIVILCIVKQ